MTTTALPGVVAASRRRTGGPVVLGYNAQGANARGFAAGRLQVTKWTLASAGTLTELHAWFRGTSGSPQVRIVIYADSSGVPGARLAYTAPFTLPNTGVAAEFSETGLSVSLAAGDYWIGYISAGTVGSAFFDTLSQTARSISTGATFTPPPDPFGAGTSISDKFSCWAIVT